MNKAKFITLDNGLTILIYTDNSKSTNHVELYTFFGGNNGEYVDYNGNTAWHFIAKQSPIMFNYLSEDKDKFLSIISVKNNKGESPFSRPLRHHRAGRRAREFPPRLGACPRERASSNKACA